MADTILVVDDEEGILQALSAILRASNTEPVVRVKIGRAHV